MNKIKSNCLLFPVWWQNFLGFVVACKSVNATFNKNQTKLGVFVLKHTLSESYKMYSVCHFIDTIYNTFISNDSKQAYAVHRKPI